MSDLIITPISRHQNQVEYSDGRRTIRCSTHQNFWNYKDEGGILHPVDLTHEDEIYSSRNQRIEYHRPKNIFSVGMRGDGEAQKFIGIRPDFDQVYGNEQFEITISEIRFDGEIQPILLDQKILRDNYTTDFGSVVVRGTHNGLRAMVKATNQIHSFQIKYTFHVKGLTIEKRGNEFWVFSTLPGKPFRMRIGKPRLLNMNMEVLTDPGALEPLDFVTHILIDNSDGTFTYIKNSNVTFEPTKLPSDFLIDVDIYYDSTADGYVYNGNANFYTSRNGTTGSGINISVQRYEKSTSALLSLGIWYVSRAFLYFDTSGINMSGKFATLNIAGYENNNSQVIAQKGTQADTLVVGDFDSFEGAPDGPIIADFGDSWILNQYNTAIINNNNYIIDGTTKICCRERDHDRGNSQPGSNILNGNYFAEATSGDPYIEVDDKLYIPQIMLIH